MADAMTRFTAAKADRDEARKAAELLERAAGLGHGALALLQANGEKLDLPPSLLHAMRSMLSTLAETGEAVLLNPEQDISPEKAAEILGISRPLVYQRMNAGKLPYRQVGTHRRVRVSDVVALKAFEDRRQSFAAALSADTEELEEHHARPGKSSP